MPSLHLHIGIVGNRSKAHTAPHVRFGIFHKYRIEREQTKLFGIDDKVERRSILFEGIRNFSSHSLKHWPEGFRSIAKVVERRANTGMCAGARKVKRVHRMGLMSTRYPPKEFTLHWMLGSW